MKIIDLSGYWSVRDSENQYRFEMTMPGDIIHGLLSNGLIPDPFYGRNERDMQWIGRRDWILEKDFVLPVMERPVILELETLDTEAEIFINEKSIGTSGNMFLPFSRNVEELLNTGKNRLKVVIRSPEKAAEEKAARQTYPHPFMKYPIQAPHRNLLRKVQCHGGWDWGPCLMTGGIYGRMELHSGNTPWIKQVWFRQQPAGKDFDLYINMEIESRNNGEFVIETVVNGDLKTLNISIKKGKGIYSQRIRVAEPPRWDPVGYGEPQRVPVSLRTETQTITMQTGFRSLILECGEDSHGRSMAFIVNGRRIFAKGACWIPLDSLPGRQTEERYRQLLTDARDAGMNMIRVWGGGQYERDCFYDICDELGLLVWQDYMFACSTYPTDNDFLETVENEAKFQTRRLGSHPSVVLFCGNNENIQALDWFEETRKNRDRYIIDFDRLNNGVLERICRKEAPEIPWWPSSPSGGPGDLFDTWDDDSRGDMHYWKVWHGGEPFDSFYKVVPRFCSEFGFQSFPEMASVKKFIDTDQLNLTSPQMRHHQKNDRGNSIILETMSRYFRIGDHFEDLLYLSQVQQAMAIKTAVDYWRSKRDRCMGTLYWQLNDTWPGPSWSSIDYYGRWKLLHYEAKRFYAPLYLTAFVKDGAVQLWGINDTEKKQEISFRTLFMGFDGTETAEKTEKTVLPAESAVLLFQTDLPADTETRENMFFLFQYRSGDLHNNGFCLLTEPRDCRLIQPQISVNTDNDVIILTTDTPAFYVTITTAEPVRFCDNGFLLIPGSEKRVTCETGNGNKSQSLLQELDIKHLRGTYA